MQKCRINLHTVTMRKHLLNNIILNHNLEAFNLIIHKKQRYKNKSIYFNRLICENRL